MTGVNASSRARLEGSKQFRTGSKLRHGAGERPGTGLDFFQGSQGGWWVPLMAVRTSGENNYLAQPQYKHVISVL